MPDASAEFSWRRTSRLAVRAATSLDVPAVAALAECTRLSGFFPDGSLDAHRLHRLRERDRAHLMVALRNDVVVGAVTARTGRLRHFDGGGSDLIRSRLTADDLEPAPPPTETLWVDAAFCLPGLTDEAKTELLVTQPLAREAAVRGIERVVAVVPCACDLDRSPYTPSGFLEQAGAGAIDDAELAPWLDGAFRIQGGWRSQDDPTRLHALVVWRASR